MPQSKILVDTCSYLRLAKDIRPLLQVEFGEPKYCLYVLNETNNEILASPRLRTKFYWALEEEHVAERNAAPCISKKQKQQIDAAHSVIWEHIQSEAPGPSKVDALYLAFSHVTGIPVITDDRDMREIAEVFDITTVKSLQMLKILLDISHLDVPRIKGIVGYWSYHQDIPHNFMEDLQLIFEGRITLH